MMKACGKMVHSNFVMLRKEEKEGKKGHDPELRKKYPKDWVYEMITAKSDPNLERIYHITQCTFQIMFDELGVEELKPYCDFSDILGAKILKYGYSSKHGTDDQGDFLCEGTMLKGKECEIPDHLKFAFEGLEF